MGGTLSDCHLNVNSLRKGTMKKSITLKDAAMFGQCLTSMPACRLSSNTIKAMAKNLNIINQAFPDMMKVQADLLAKHGYPVEGPSPEYKAYLEEKIQFEKSTRIEVELKEIRYEDLKIGAGEKDNHFPAHAVAALMIMIKSDEGQ